MANQHKEKLRGVDDQLWTDFESATTHKNTDRSNELRRYMEVVRRRPNAELPERPEPPPAD